MRHDHAVAPSPMACLPAASPGIDPRPGLGSRPGRASGFLRIAGRGPTLALGASFWLAALPAVPASAAGPDLAAGTTPGVVDEIAEIVEAGERPDGAAAATPQRQRFRLPAGPLGASLLEIARQAGQAISIAPDLVAGRFAPAIDADLTVEEAARQALADSPLDLVRTANGTLSLRRRPAAQGSPGQPATATTARPTTVLPTVTVAARRYDPVGLPEAYADGQVARGASLGLLGNVDVMSAPVSITSYTDKVVADQQARSIADVISRNDPSVRLDFGEGTSVDALYIRGFPLVNDELSLNGLPGILGQYRVSPEFAQRIEVLKGPSVLFNGMSPGGAVGGAVNVVAKRAPDEPLNRVTAGYQSSSIWGIGADVARRFGEDRAFGIRVNTAARQGSTARDNLTEQARVGSVGLDFRHARVKASLDLISQRQHTYGARGTVSLDNGLAAPAAPDGRRNAAPAWNHQKSTDNTVMGRVDLEITDSLSAFATVGRSSDRTSGITSNPATVAPNGDFFYASIPIDWRQTTTSAQLGLRGRLLTGPVRHEWSAIAATIRRDADSLFDFAGLTGNSGPANIYRTNDAPAPTQVSHFADPYVWTQRTRLPSVAVADTLSMADDRVRLTVGLRRQSLKSDSVTGMASTGFAPVSYDRSATSPMLGIVVRPRDWLSLYANALQGLSMGESAPLGTANVGAVFPPYKSKQLEIGAKVEWGQVAGSISLFQIKRPSGMIDPVTNLFSVDQTQRNRGIELMLHGEVARGVRVLGGASFIDAELTDTVVAAQAGNRPIGTPRQLVNVGAEWDLPALTGLTLSARAVHTGATWADTANQVRVASWTVVDIGARYATRFNDHPVTLRAGIENLLDKQYWRQGTYATLGMPRTFLMSASFDF